MNAPQKFLAWMVAGAIIILLIMAYLGANLPAHAHDWYTSKKDPRSQISCCGGHDCSAIPASWVEEVEGGVRIRMTLEQAQQVNPTTIAPVDAFVPEDRIQQSPDLEWHACVYNSNRTAPTFGIICAWGFRGA
jgi:hypothetical protein